MKTIALQIRVNFADKDMIKDFVSNASSAQQPMSIDDIRNAVKILDVLEASQDNLILEDAQYNWLVAKIKGMRFLKASRELLEFLDGIVAAT